MKNIFSKENLIIIGLAAFFYLLILFVGAWWLGICFIGIGLAYSGWVLYETNWCKPGSCNGMFFIPGILSILIGWFFISASFEAA
jgi:hypothetical protein